MTNQRFDIVYKGGTDECSADYHFCREWDETGNGCYGTNPDHGYSFEEAREEVATYYENKAKRIRGTTFEESEERGFI